jgi:hypothetical protein
MPVFYLDLFGSELRIDRIGLEFASEGAARQEAILRSLNDSSFRLAHYRNFDRISVRDDFGKIVCEVPIDH